MAPVELDEQPEQNDQDAPITKTIGIIYPPPEVRNIVDKTASFVARNGPEFETRIRQNELNNPKFNFLNPTDPYHAYYQHKVKEFKEGKGQEPMIAPKGLSMLLHQQQLQQQQQQQLKQAEQAKNFTEQIVLKDPPPEFEFVADPPSISAFDLDVVKLTAQFVARNGRQFLTNLMHREQRNYQFDFLRPQHSLFNYFTKLVEQYTKILIPPKDLVPKLRKEADNAKGILDKARYRVEWAKYQERERQKEEEEKERERVAYASVDWHDFVVVETVDFQPNETGNLPPPTTPEEVGARVIAQERYEETPEEREAIEMDVASSDEEDESEMPSSSIVERKPPQPAVGDNIQVQDMEEDSDEEIDGRMAPPSHPPVPSMPPPPPLPPKESPQPPPLPPAPDQVIIKPDYNPKVARTQEEKDNFLVSPITGEKIPADKLQEHMRIGLLDPAWMADHQRTMHTEKKDQAEVYAPGSAIGSSLKMLAERRTDIFGPGVEETQIGKKIGEEEKKEKSKVIWDGHTASMEKVTQKARENISIEEQIAVIHKAKGLLQDEEKEKIGPAMPKGGGPQQQPLLQPPPPMPKPPSQPPKPAPPPPSRPPMPNQGGGPGPPHRPGVMVMPMGHQGMRPVGMPQRPPMPMMGGPPMGMGGGYMGGPPMGGPPMMAPRPPQMPPQPPQMPPRRPEPPQEEDQPPSKKAKTEDNLIPEDIFLANNQSPVHFKVSVPKMPDKGEWKLTGQTVTLTLPLTDNVSVIKAKLHEAVGMPAGKQKLQVDGLFIKDSNTLAFYNIGPSTNIQLQLKERGGRKK